jgi:hypothetical protein
MTGFKAVLNGLASLGGILPLQVDDPSTGTSLGSA